MPALGHEPLRHAMNLLEERIQRPRFVISVAGGAKSGKSTFINALLGEDLLPNGDEVCAVTSTNIIFQDHDHQIIKYFQDGHVEVVSGNPLAHVFYEEVKNSKKAAALQRFQYQIQHKLHALSSWAPREDADLVIVDMPGYAEEAAMHSFKKTLEQTDLLLYVLDIERDPEGEALEVIKGIRPDLLEHAVFIVNKTDIIFAEDIDKRLQEISHSLRALGIHDPKLYPVSSKTALYTRLAEKRTESSAFYLRELAPHIPAEEIGAAGNLQVKSELAEALSVLIQKSGIQKAEDEIFVPIFLDLSAAMKQSLQQHIMRQVHRIGSMCNEEVQQLTAKIGQKQNEVQAHQAHQASLLKLMEQHHDVAEQLQEQIQSTAAILQKEEAIQPYAYTVSLFPYHTENEGFLDAESAKHEAQHLIDAWLKEELEGYQENISALSEKGLRYENSLYNYFALINELAKKELSTVNQDIYEYGCKYPKTVDYVQSPERLLPNELHVSTEIDRKKYYENIHIDSYEVSHKDQVWLVFKKTKYITHYKYNVQSAVWFAEKDVNERIAVYSGVYHQAYIQEKYEKFPQRVIKSALHELEKSRNKVQLLLFQVKEEVQEIEKELHELHSRITLISNMKNRIVNRTKLLAAAQPIYVMNDENLNALVQQAEPGTTFWLDEGEYIIDQPILMKSLAFAGKGAEQTKIILKSPLFHTTVHDSFIFEDIAVQFDSTEDATIKIDGYFFTAVNCVFLDSSRNKTMLEIAGETEGQIINSVFSGSLTAVAVGTTGDFTIQASLFTNNDTAVLLQQNAAIAIMKNRFESNRYAAVVCKDYANGTISDNLFYGDASYGVISCDASKLDMKRNEITGAISGIYVTDKAEAAVSENTCTNNETGILVEVRANIVLLNNKVNDNTHGIRACGDSAISCTKNTIEQNREIGMHVTDNVRAELFEGNSFYDNTNGLYIEGTARGTMENNHFQSNKENGAGIFGNTKIWFVNNTCSQHSHAGVICGGAAYLVMMNNSIEENGIGVQLKEEATAEVKHNIFARNTSYGMKISDSVTGTVTSNQYHENGSSAFWVDTAKEIEFADNKQIEKGLTRLKPQYWYCKMKMKRSNQKAKKLKRSSIRANERVLE